MKLSFLSLLFCLVASNLKSQVGIFRLNDKDYEALKKTTTYFIIPSMEKDKKQEYIDAIQGVWNFTPIKVVTTEEAKTINFQDISKSSISLKAMEYLNGSNLTTYWKYGMFLTMFYQRGKTELVEKIVSRVFFCNVKTGSKDRDEKTNTINAIHYNYSLGFVKNCLQNINANLLLNSGEQTELCNSSDKEELKKVAIDTLYIPTYVAEFYDGKIEDALAEAKFNYKAISVKDLEKKILENKKEFYYLNFTIDVSDKAINIINSRNGKIAYNYFAHLSITLKNKDISKLNGLLKVK